MDKRTCSVDGCNNPSRSKGLCRGHYTQHHRGQPLRPLKSQISAEDKFWSQVDKSAPGGCWAWTTSTSAAGYGRLRFGGTEELAHRFSWELVNGPIPDGLVIDHRCANRKCVNPEHLRAVTVGQNVQHRTGPTRKSKSGVRGVYWDKRQKAWCATARLHRRNYFGGYHSTLEAADRAARALRAQLFTHDDHDEWVKTQTAPPKNDEAA